MSVIIHKGDVSFQAEFGGEKYGFWQLLENDMWEPHTYRTFAKYLNKDHGYVDIGAWAGPTVLYGCQLARHCYAVEPDPVAVDWLRKHIAMNGFSNITVFEGAISDMVGTTRLGASELGESMTSLLFDRININVPCLTLEAFFDEHKITDCNFIKMDIEGGECIVLPQAIRFLAQIKPVLYVALHFPWLTSDQRQTIVETLRPYHIEAMDGRTLTADEIETGEIIVTF